MQPLHRERFGAYCQSGVSPTDTTSSTSRSAASVSTDSVTVELVDEETVAATLAGMPVVVLVLAFSADPGRAETPIAGTVESAVPEPGVTSANAVPLPAVVPSVKATWLWSYRHISACDALAMA